MRVDADLDGVHPESADALRFGFADHDGVGLDLDVELQEARVFENFKKVAAEEYFTSAESEKKDAGFGQLIKHTFDFGGRHLAMIFVIEITVHAALVATISDVQMNTDWHAHIKCLLAHFVQQAHRASGICGSWS